MRKAGAIMALLAGITGVISTIFALLFGDIDAPDEAGTKDMLINTEWGGLIFSFLIIVLGAIVLGVNSSLVAVLLIVCAIAGAILADSVVAICMVLAIVAGFLAIYPQQRKQVTMNVASMAWSRCAG